jgi:hypothetical protein
MTRPCRTIIALVLATLTGAGLQAAPQPTDPATLRTRIEQMKASPKGPFSRIRWFCNDGTVLPPKAYACRDHGGGHQHGEWTQQVRTLRAQGYKVANVLAGTAPDEIAGSAPPPAADTLNQILIEQFLIHADDGWILRGAQYYRGALQSEDETAAARGLLLYMLSDPAWIEHGFLPLRMTARLLPHGTDTGSIVRVREHSLSLSKKDPGFLSLRVKIHNKPDPEDAERVREYAAGVHDPALSKQYHELAEEIEQAYAVSASKQLARLASQVAYLPDLTRALSEGAKALADKPDPQTRYGITAQLLARLRESLAEIRRPGQRLEALDASLALETEHFIAATGLRDGIAGASRSERIRWLKEGVDAISGVGLISAREYQALEKAFARLEGKAVSLKEYRDALSYLARVPGWSSQRLRYYFWASMQKLAEIEPLANRFIQDQLRASPLLFYSAVLDSLSRDANQLAGVRYRFFGEELGSGLRALNPGLTRGRLHTRTTERFEDFDAEGIYLLAETTADLPPVAGILTAGEGNPLSHVQLLARNLGIPNVAVDEALISALAEHEGEAIILAVTPAGQIQIEADHGQLDEVFRRERGEPTTLIHPDLEKLDLTVVDFLSLSRLRARDSGRTVGPKAAKLGELKHHYPEAVTEGLAIPFGAFRELLRQPKGSQSAYHWMVGEYQRLGQLPEGSPERAKATETFRAELQDWVLHGDPGDAFRDRLRAAMEREFGPHGRYGVFVRSDTNVEDLPGFTGAGLNETVPNVVGFEHVVKAISEVWASPFSRRAFAWRQAHMDRPEHVYPAVLLLRSVPSEKSGVMVTHDIDTGDRDWLSVAVNEGVGGAVEGQAAESLRINIRTGEVRLLEQSTATERAVLDPRGGMDKVPVSGRDRVLEPGEIKQLITLARDLPQRFPPIVDSNGDPAPADIEFGFVDARLRLFQLRPFLESAQARGSLYLNSLDANMTPNDNMTVRLDAKP